MNDPGSVRAHLDHPIVDGDGHVVESVPVLVEYIRAVAGSDVADRFIGSSPSYASRRAPCGRRSRPAPPSCRVGSSLPGGPYRHDRRAGLDRRQQRRPAKA